MLRRVNAVIRASVNSFVYPDGVVGWPVGAIGVIMKIQVKHFLKINQNMAVWTKRKFAEDMLIVFAKIQFDYFH